MWDGYNIYGTGIIDFRTGIDIYGTCIPEFRMGSIYRTGKQ